MAGGTACPHSPVRFAALPQFPQAPHSVLLAVPEGWQCSGEEQKSVPAFHSPATNAVVVSSVPMLLLWGPVGASSSSQPSWMLYPWVCLGRKRLKCRDFLAVMLGREGDLQKCFASSVAPAGLAKHTWVSGSCWSETELETQLEFGLLSPKLKLLLSPAQSRAAWLRLGVLLPLASYWGLRGAAACPPVTPSSERAKSDGSKVGALQFTEPFHRFLLGSAASPPAALPGWGRVFQPPGLGDNGWKGQSFVLRALAGKTEGGMGRCWGNGARSERQMQGVLVPWEMPGVGGGWGPYRGMCCTPWVPWYEGAVRAVV